MPPPPDGFQLINTVQPVSIVDADVALAAVTTSQLLDIPFSAGLVVAPAINTVLADTGAQPTGSYLLQIFASCLDGVNFPQICLQRRDAANAANIWQHFFLAAGAANYGPFNLVLSIRVQLQLNERVRVINTIAGGGGSNFHVSIWLTAS